MTSLLRKTPTEEFYSELLNTGMFSDITLDLGTLKHPGHTAILMGKSKWFAKQCPGKKSLKLIRPPPDLLEHFGFHKSVDEQFEHGFRVLLYRQMWCL